MATAIARVLSDVFNNDLSRVVLAVICLVGTFALLLLEKPVPTEVWLLDTAAITFYFSVAVAKTGR